MRVKQLLDRLQGRENYLMIIIGGLLLFAVCVGTAFGILVLEGLLLKWVLGLFGWAVITLWEGMGLALTFNILLTIIKARR